MLDNLIYSLNATIPVFFVIVTGYLLKQIKMLDDHFCTVANRFNYNVTLPALLFYDIATAPIRECFDLTYILYCAGVTTVSFFSIWILARLLQKDRSLTGAFVQASFRGSAAVLGVAFIQNMYGNAGMAPLMIIGCVPLYNIYSVIVLTFESRTAREGGQNRSAVIRQACLNIIRNPIILAILAGMVFSLSGITLPAIALKTVKSVANLATPLALIIIGATFEGTSALTKIKPTIAASLIKLVIQPALFLPLGIALGFRNELLIAALIMLAAPTTASCYIMAKNMDNDEVLTTSVVVLTTLLSSVTLTVWIYLLKTLGYLA